MADTEITFFDYIGIILKYRKLILVLVFLAAIFAMFYSVFFGSPYSAEVKLWSDEPSRTVEFLKSRETLSSVTGKFLSDAEAKGNIIVLTVRTSEQALAISAANKLAAKAIEREREFAARVLENQKKTAENKWVFTLELFEKSPIKKEIDLSAFPQMSPNNPPFVSILNEATLVTSGSRVILIIRNIFFGAVLGAFFGIILAFVKEYISRYKAEWIETKRKYLNK